jgi:uncharacterized integral membrane protein
MKRLMKQLFIVLILVPLAFAAVALATVNRHDITIYLDPLATTPSAGIQVTAPLYIVVFAAVMAGVILGGVTTYLEQGKYRRTARRVRREVEVLQKELARLSPPRPGERKIS